MKKQTTQQKREINNRLYDYLQITVRKSEGGKDRYKQAAEQVGQSLNAFIISAIEEKIIRDGITDIPNCSNNEIKEIENIKQNGE